MLDDLHLSSTNCMRQVCHCCSNEEIELKDDV
jgi:hypothetical protein